MGSVVAENVVILLIGSFINLLRLFDNLTSIAVQRHLPFWRWIAFSTQSRWSSIKSTNTTQCVRLSETESEKYKLAFTVILRKRSPLVKCGLVQQFNRPKRVFDVSLNTKAEPAPLDWNTKSVPGKRNSKIRIRMPRPPSSPTSNRNNIQ